MITLVLEKVSLKVSAGKRHRKVAGAGDSAGGGGSAGGNSEGGDTKSSLLSGLSPWIFPSATGWGKMTTAMGKLERSERKHSFRHRPSFVGPFRYAHRALLPISDGRAWHHRQSSQGGTVLIDKSGSMLLTPDMILEFLHKRPLATVAIYEGWQDNEEGILTIIAKANRYTDAIPIYDGGNVVDGPALRWLARQEKPRIWVCDGGITGVSDIAANPLMSHEVKIIVKRAGIKQVRGLSQATGAI